MKKLVLVMVLFGISLNVFVNGVLMIEVVDVLIVLKFVELGVKVK